MDGQLPDISSTFNPDVGSPQNDAPSTYTPAPDPNNPATHNVWLDFLMNAAKGAGGGAGNAPQAPKGVNMSGTGTPQGSSSGKSAATGAVTSALGGAAGGISSL